MTNYRILLATGISVLAIVLQSAMVASPAYADTTGTPTGGAVPLAQAGGSGTTQSGTNTVSGGTQAGSNSVPGGTQSGSNAVPGGTQSGSNAVPSTQSGCYSSVTNSSVPCNPGYVCDTTLGICVQQSGGTQSGSNTVPGGTQSGTNAVPSTQASNSTTLINPLGAGTSLTTLIADIMSLVTRVGIVVVILMLVYVGFLFVTAQGNESKLTQAKTALMWTVIGALILLGAQAIAYGIQATAQALSVGG